MQGIDLAREFYEEYGKPMLQRDFPEYIDRIAVGLVGIAMVSINYFIYKANLKARRKKASAEIFRLSNEILGNV